MIEACLRQPLTKIHLDPDGVDVTASSRLLLSRIDSQFSLALSLVSPAVCDSRKRRRSDFLTLTQKQINMTTCFHSSV